MSDAQGNPLQFAGEGTTPNASQPAAPNQQAGGEPQTGEGTRYMTAEDAQKLFDQLFERKAQSITDRTTARVQKVLATAQAQGVQLTAEQAQRLLDTADQERPQPQAQPNQPAASPATAPAQVPQQESQAAPQGLHPVLQTAQAMMQRAGVEINDDDPEVAKIDSQTTDELTFLQSVQAAITAKAERLKKAGAPARMPSMTGGGRPANPVTSITDPNELWKLATRK